MSMIAERILIASAILLAISILGIAEHHFTQWRLSR